ncbi:MAG: T9SS type A sorting domain-containing protein, partial [Chitinophagales bacterium]|nr:T9SS type A sorting domain-containing protein [Chitinophagales bacterium]
SISPAGTVTFCLSSTAQLTASPSGFGITYQWFRNNVLFAGQTNQVVNVTNNGTYTVEVSNGICSSTSNGTSAVKLKAGSANITVIGNLDICTSGSVTLKCSAGTVTYQWNKGGLPIAGATNQLYTATATGDYTVTITSTINGCSKTSTIVTVFTSCKLNEAAIDDAALSLYPNPTSGNFIIEMNFSSSLTSDADVELINSLGQIVYTQQTAITDGKLQSEVKLNNDFAAGNYFVRVIASDKVYNGIIIYQK